MPSHSYEEPVELQVFTYNCVIAASFVILYYDYLLTFEQEFKLYWSKERRTFTFASVLFFTNRYFTIFGHIPAVFSYTGNWPEMNRLDVSIDDILRCLWINGYNQYMIVLTQFIIGTMAIRRTYLLYYRDIKVLVVLWCVGVGATVYGTVSILRLRKAQYTLNDLPPTGCRLPTSSPMAHGLAEAWEAHLFFDTLIFGLTLYQSLKTETFGFHRVVHVMMRDGAMYFGIMIIGSISVILSFYLLPSYIRGLTATLTNILSSTMMSRLMLNLRGEDERENVPAILSGLVFAKSSPESVDLGQRPSYDDDGIHMGFDVREIV